MSINRVIVIVLDSVGIGEAPDAAAYGDVGSHTLGNMARAVGGLQLPNLEQMGLGNIAILEGVIPQERAHGRLRQDGRSLRWQRHHHRALGTDGPASHCGPFRSIPMASQPRSWNAFEARIGRGTLGNYPASGTEIIDELGAEHMRSGRPIIYTSGDSVFQIAAHEEVIPIDELYRICESARELLRGEHEVSRVIARPFVGEPGAFERTANRHDYSVVPPATDAAGQPARMRA